MYLHYLKMSYYKLLKDKELCRNWWVYGTDHAGARLAALGPSCIYRPRPPYF